MPNWCMTNYAVYPRKKENLNELLRFYIDMSKGANNSFGGSDQVDPDHEGWFGNLFIAAGYKVHDGELRDYNLRGFNTEVELRDAETDPHVAIFVEMAWSPEYRGMWDMLSEKYPGLGFVMEAEEPGCEVYVNTDTTGDFFPEKWRIEYEYHNYTDESGKEVEGASESLYFGYGEEAKALSTIEELTGLKFKSMEEALEDESVLTEAFYKKHGDEAEENGAYLSVNEFVDIY